MNDVPDKNRISIEKENEGGTSRFAGPDEINLCR